MENRLNDILNGRTQPNMLPFFWQHGENEETLRKYVRVMKNANCDAFCVESRPHPDFCGPKWWADLDAIIDEAKKNDMKVWILDDTKFPTGYANGIFRSEENSEYVRHQVYMNFEDLDGDAADIEITPERFMKYPPWFEDRERPFTDDRILCVVAYDSMGVPCRIEGNVFHKPEGRYRLCCCFTTRNLTCRYYYMDVTNRTAVRMYLDAVHEKHYDRYRDEFGKTLLGFFSDEPEFGNAPVYRKHTTLGIDFDQPWGTFIEKELGDPFLDYLPLLWLNDMDPDLTAEVRIRYMDTITNLVKNSFSLQIGDWCRAHNVMYIGHLIEDGNSSMCTANSLGHFFRGLYGMGMSGIDNICNQVLPQREDIDDKRDGLFYHYMLGKLAVSAAQLEPAKNGRTMCEIFGAYGWHLGCSEMKYQADHFLVRGINHFTPHAFSPKEYPDGDCPPHFYAHGKNPVYRHIGKLFGYMNRVANLFSDGELVTKVAILYNAESEWADNNIMFDEYPAQVLYDNQIDYTIIPVDYLDQADRFGVVIVPECNYVVRQVAALKNAVYINRLPKNVSGTVVPLEELALYIRDKGLCDVTLSEKNDRIRVMHYRHDGDAFMIVNEGTAVYRGEISLPVAGPYYEYDAWENTTYAVSWKENRITVCVEPRKSLIVICGDRKCAARTVASGKRTELRSWTRSVCTSLCYPDFTDRKQVILPDSVNAEDRYYVGFARYETDVDIPDGAGYTVEITGENTAVELFVNGVSAGIQVVSPYVYDISGLIRKGNNSLRIETASTLERDAIRITEESGTPYTNPVECSLGINGSVFLTEN